MIDNNPAGPMDSFAAERAARLRSRRAEGAESPQLFADALATKADAAITEAARRAYDFASQIEYDHPGLSPAAYLAHPARVAVMSLQLDAQATADTVVLALLHNVFEVSRVAPAEVAAQFGDGVEQAIHALTVDRTAISHEYRLGYYANLARQPRFVRVVKMLDKLDNLFILGINPDATVRADYLRDIEEFVVPMVTDTLPQLSEYFGALVVDTHTVGFYGETNY